MCANVQQILRAIVTTLKEIGAKSAFTDGDVQSAKYDTFTLVVAALIDCCEYFTLLHCIWEVYCDTVAWYVDLCTCKFLFFISPHTFAFFRLFDICNMT